MDKINEKLKQLFDSPQKEVDINDAALLLLQLNRNRILYQNLVRRNDVAKCLYELRKYYNDRVARGLIKSNDKIKKVEKSDALVPFNLEKVEASEKKGMRADHESLPDEIKGLYLENLNIYPVVRKLHEQLKLMIDATSEERKVILDELLELDKRHSSNFERYDNFNINNLNEETADPVELGKKISAARKYLSINKEKAEGLEGEEKNKLLEKMQVRLDLLIQNDAGISDEQRDEYRKIGLNV